MKDNTLTSLFTSLKSKVFNECTINVIYKIILTIAFVVILMKVHNIFTGEWINVSVIQKIQKFPKHSVSLNQSFNTKNPIILHKKRYCFFGTFAESVFIILNTSCVNKRIFLTQGILENNST